MTGRSELYLQLGSFFTFLFMVFCISLFSIWCQVGPPSDRDSPLVFHASWWFLVAALCGLIKAVHM